jgi:hypothetical protein
VQKLISTQLRHSTVGVRARIIFRDEFARSGDIDDTHGHSGFRTATKDGCRGGPRRSLIKRPSFNSNTRARVRVRYVGKVIARSRQAPYSLAIPSFSPAERSRARQFPIRIAGCPNRGAHHFA